jgi:hypothetical protein
MTVTISRFSLKSFTEFRLRDSKAAAAQERKSKTLNSNLIKTQRPRILFAVVVFLFSNFDLSGRCGASGGKLFGKKLGKNFSKFGF